jgi:hypothetical protein
MKSKILILVVLVLLLVTAVTIRDSLKTYTQKPVEETPLPPGGEMIACTMDAMMCLDGSYVGRTGPNCEFVCPASTSAPTDLFEMRLNATTTIKSATLTVKEVIEDSRCPVDVTCIQAGTVRVKTLVSRAGNLTEQIFELNKPTTADDKSTLELINVTPAPHADVPIQKGDYRFTFKVTESVPQAI